MKENLEGALSLKLERGYELAKVLTARIERYILWTQFEKAESPEPASSHTR